MTKGDEKSSSDLIGKFTIIETEFNLSAVFSEFSHFSYRGSVNDKPHQHSNNANEQKKVFKESLMFFALRLGSF